MKLQFTNMDSESVSEIELSTQQELDDFFKIQCAKKPFIGELKTDYDHKLDVGFSAKVGFVQHMHTNLQPPYLMAVTKTNLVKEDFEFMCGGTATPISPQYCLSIDEVKDVIWCYIETSQIHEDFKWEST